MREDPPNHPAIAPFPAGLSVAFTCSDHDEMAERADYWEMEANQLGRGTFEASIRAVHSARIQLSAARRSPGLLLRGSGPSGTVVLASLVRPSAPTFYRGIKVADHEVILATPGEALDFRCIGGDELLTVAIDATLFDEVASVTLGPAFGENRSPDRLALRGPGMRDRLNRRLAKRLAEGITRPDLLCHPESGRDWEYRVLDAWLADVTVPDLGVAPAMRRRAARIAEAFLRETLDRPVSIGELCLVTGVPKRTLMLGFSDSFGISPLDFHRRLRLNAAHRHLAASRPGETTVTNSALRWGFDHFGRFSIDYRRMFGESPIATLRGLARVRSHAAVGIPPVPRTIGQS